LAQNKTVPTDIPAAYQDKDVTHTLVTAQFAGRPDSSRDLCSGEGTTDKPGPRYVYEHHFSACPDVSLLCPQHETRGMRACFKIENDVICAENQKSPKVFIIQLHKNPPILSHTCQLS